MGQEIERKFLVVGDDWQRRATSVSYRQGFLSTDPERTVRVRIAGDKGSLTVKGKTSGARRTEFEYDIPIADAQCMLDTLCRRPLIEKVRHSLSVGGHLWEVDVFQGANAGLVIAEIELIDEDEAFEKPSWLGDEVTNDPRYFNSSLVDHPYTAW